jgi:hypothetical protein
MYNFVLGFASFTTLPRGLMRKIIKLPWEV